MSWRDHQGAASFRGVPFYTDTSEIGGGRHLAVHEFPFSEKAPFTEDLGRKGATFTIDAYVIGEEYETARDNLEAALQKSGPGELVHPYYGTRQVAVQGYRRRESRTEGGFAKFSIDLVETLSAGAQPVVAVRNTAASVEAVAATAEASAIAQFEATYTAYTALRDSAADQLSSVSRAVGLVLNKVTLEAQAIGSLRRQVRDLANQAIGLTNAPTTLATSITELFADLGSALVGVVASPSGTLLSLYTIYLGERPPATTPARIVERANFDAIQNLVRRAVLIASARAAITEEFPNYDAAVTGRQAITDLLDDHLDDTADDVYPELSQLRAELVLAVPGFDSDLPRLQRYTPPRTVPSLVLAHRLYGDVSRESDLVLRNRVKNPGFVLGGVELEILTDAP